MEETSVGTVSNYYGGIYVLEKEGKYFWTIQNYSDIEKEYEEIPKYLYDALIRFEENRI